MTGLSLSFLTFSTMGKSRKVRARPPVTSAAAASVSAQKEDVNKAEVETEATEEQDIMDSIQRQLLEGEK